MGWVFVAVGAFSICGAALDWDWFMNSRRARLFVRVFGRKGARVIYSLVGLTLVILGGLFLMGFIEQ